ncbi:MAG TPA: hypothetical protein VN441_00780, partial [Syntrophomonas sp.]|nr:hypothetical protein [Syntrophomonas sp.]
IKGRSVFMLYNMRLYRMKQQKKQSPTLLQSVLHTNSDLTERFAPNINRSLKVTGASGVANIFIGLGKLSIGIVSISFFHV